ncbi:MAG: hypothetical protein FJ302_18965, partial [Planctomycetes bacterium]|nr:hypothetical protein [Planctomycetota bacterium]
AEDLKREQAALNERIENLPQNKPADPDAKPNALQAAREQAEQAQQALEAGDLNKAAEAQQQAAQALSELAKKADEAKADQPPENPKPNETNVAEEAKKVAELAKEQRQLARAVEQALNEQRGEQQQAKPKDAKEQPMPAEEQPDGENPPTDQRREDNADQNKKQDQPDNTPDDPEDAKIVMTVQLRNPDGKSLDVREYLKRGVPLFRESRVAFYNYPATDFELHKEVNQTVSWHSAVSLPIVASKLQGKAFEVFQGRPTAGAFLEVARFEPELADYVLFSVKPSFPVATLSNDLNPEDLELPPGLDRLANWARDLAKDSDGTQEGIAKRLRDELQSRGGFRYLKRNAVVANPQKPLNVEDFLFNENQKRGHCEYFADALTLMLRAVNIPARTVGGFRGGRYQSGDANNPGGSLIVQKKHGHAWVEAHLNGRWIVLDGTPGGGIGQPPAGNEQANANQQPMPENGQKPAGENAQPNQQPSNNQQPKAGEQPNAGQPMNPMPGNAGEQPKGDQPQQQPGQNPQAQPRGENQQPQVAQQVRETQQAQQELAQQASQLQKQIEQELGKDSPEAKQSQQTARLCES